MKRLTPDCPLARTRRAARRRRHWLGGGAAACLLLAGGCAHLGDKAPASAVADPVERFAQAQVQLLPVGRLLDAAAAQDARWPLAGKADMVSGAQLACVRRTLSDAEVTARQRQAARDYARAHPDTLADELQVLENGAARLFGEAMLAGAGLIAAPAPATARETEALAAFAAAPRFAALRRASGLDRLIGPAAARTADPARRGSALGQQLLIRSMTDAFLRCHIPVQLLY